MKNRTKCFLTISVMTLLFTACSSYNPETQAYDTAKNQDNFPPMSIAMLNDIENGHLRTVDSLTDRFASLYTSYPELLDNPKWKSLIERLGQRLAHLGEKALQETADSSRAAAYFYLAAMALPDSKEFASRRDSLAPHLQLVLDTTL